MPQEMSEPGAARRGPTAPHGAGAAERIAGLLARLAPPTRERIAAFRRLRLPAGVPPWTDTGLALDAGDAVTWLAEGRIVLSEPLDLWLGPRLALWGRVGGEAPLENGTGAVHTFRAARAGRLELAIYQGEWGDGAGRLAATSAPWGAFSGGFDVLLIHWSGDPAEGLAALRAAAPEELLLAAAAAEAAAPRAEPPGWHPHPVLGRSAIFRAGPHGGAIEAHAENDVGILCHPLDAPLGEETTLAWRWCIDRLPAREAEDTLPTHDYLSVALAFDDGRDLTWTWSAALPAGRAYACPLPYWRERETHLVVRTGAEGLGAWQRETRRVAADVRHAMAAPVPARITAVWLIAVSIFRHGTASARFADIELRDGARVWRVAGGGSET